MSLWIIRRIEGKGNAISGRKRWTPRDSNPYFLSDSQVCSQLHQGPKDYAHSADQGVTPGCGVDPSHVATTAALAAYAERDEIEYPIVPASSELRQRREVHASREYPVLSCRSPVIHQKG